MAKKEKDEDEDEEKEEGAEENAPVKKKPLVKIIIIAVASLIVIGAGTAGALYYFSRAGEAKKVAASAVPPPVAAVLWSIEPFIVNLADNQGERYLKVVMQMEVSSMTTSTEMDQLKPKLRDNILDLLTAKTYTELMDMGGKQRLRDEIVTRLNSFLTKGKIVRVYFTEFVIQ
ncbi:MAG: flagellar basal body-associated FliL family protein [Syntrophales bacterium]